MERYEIGPGWGDNVKPVGYVWTGVARLDEKDPPAFCLVFNKHGKPTQPEYQVKVPLSKDRAEDLCRALEYLLGHKKARAA